MKGHVPPGKEFTYNAERQACFPGPIYGIITRDNLMMTPSNLNIFRVTGPLWGEFTGDRWQVKTSYHKISWNPGVAFRRFD